MLVTAPVECARVGPALRRAYSGVELPDDMVDLLAELDRQTDTPSRRH